MATRTFFCWWALTLVFLVLMIQMFLYYKDLNFQRVFFFNSGKGSSTSVKVNDSLRHKTQLTSIMTSGKTTTRPTSATTATTAAKKTSTHNSITDTIPTTTSIKTTVTKAPDFSEERNKKCLESLLENGVVEYYYPPSNDHSTLNFSIKGIVANAKLGHDFPEPLLALRNPPPKSSYDDKLVPRNICSEALINFQPSITSAEYDTYRNIFKFFKHIAKLIDMAYYIDYGSLLGHVRFNGRPTPWDDDMDIAIDYYKRSLFEKTWTQERERLNLTGPVSFSPQFSAFKDRYKIFNDRSPRMIEHKYPFVDLFFFNSGIEDFYDVPEELLTGRDFTDAFFSSYTQSVTVETVLPFKHERFIGVELSVPAKPKDFLKEMNYINSVCISVSYSHRYEQDTKKWASVPCKSLLGFYDINVLD